MVANRLPPKHRALHDYGAAHALKVWRRFDAAFHPQRAGGRASLEGAGWQSLRTHQLEREPSCRACAARGRKTRATHVDHILSRRARPDLAADPANLQSLCAACHNAKTNRTDRGFGGPHGRLSLR